jgi:ankyrin repeat protein
MTEHGHDSVTIALFRAAFRGDTPGMRQLLNACAAVDSQDALENTPLLIAAYGGHVELAKDLLDHGAAIDHCNCTGDTALLLAAAYPIRLGQPPYEGPTERHKGHDEVVRELLERGAATHYRTLDDDSAIELAGANGNVAAALDLLAHGATFDPSNEFEGDPLRWAAAQGYAALASALLDRGASANRPSSDGSTALSWAVSFRRHDVTKILLDRGAVVDELNRALMDDWLLWLEAKVEAAYDRMYDTHNSTDAAGAYSDAKAYLDDALALARRLKLPEMAARLEARQAHIKAVFRSQFPW